MSEMRSSGLPLSVATLWRFTLGVALAIGLLPSTPLEGFASHAREQPGAQQSPPATDLDLISQNVVAFYRARLIDVWQSAGFQKLLSDKKITAQDQEEFTKIVGLAPTAIESLTVLVLGPTDDKTDLGLTFVVTAAGAYDQKAVLTAALPQAAEKEHKGKKFFISGQRPGLAMHFVNDRSLVMASPANLLAFFEAPAGHAADGPLGPVVKLASKKHYVVGGFHIPEKEAKALKQSKGSPLSHLVLATIAVDLGEKTRATVTLTFPDEKTAIEGIELAKTGLADLNKAVMLWAYVCIKANRGGDKADKAITGMALPLIAIQKGIETATVKQKGATVQIALEATMTVENHVALIQGMVSVFVKNERPGKDK